MSRGRSQHVWVRMRSRKNKVSARTYDYRRGFDYNRFGLNYHFAGVFDNWVFYNWILYYRIGKNRIFKNFVFHDYRGARYRVTGRRYSIDFDRRRR